jgi:hypothetical protein
MADYPCSCSNCGHVFFIPNMIHGPGQIDGITFTNNVLTCPRCGGWADMASGTWDYDNEVLTLLSAPEATLEALIRVREDLAMLSRSPVSEQTEEAVRQTAPPWLVSLLDGLPIKNWSQAVVILLMVLNTVLQKQTLEVEQKNLGVATKQQHAGQVIDQDQTRLDEIARLLREFGQQQTPTTSATTGPTTTTTTPPRKPRHDGPDATRPRR